MTLTKTISPRLLSLSTISLTAWLSLAVPVSAVEIPQSRSAPTQAQAAAAQTPEPKVPPGLHPGGVNVAIYDTGVNYTLPQISNNLARDGEGDLIGYDFQDDDLIPFDRRPTSNGNLPARQTAHGTSVASILLSEAPQNTAIQPYRYKADDLRSFAGMVGHTALTKTSIVAMALGGYKKEDWDLFRQAALAHPEILFVISAGNDGRDIDKTPVYPASFEIPNAIVVTSTDAFGRYPDTSNWGVKSVHISTPAEGLTGFGEDGQPRRLSGSSYAVPRIAALAARLKTKDPTLKATDLKEKILSFAGPSPGSRTKRTRNGWIPNPALLGQ